MTRHLFVLARNGVGALALFFAAYVLVDVAWMLVLDVWTLVQAMRTPPAPPAEPEPDGPADA